jgi:peptide/nickel transport system substrate-binding protein
MFDGTNIDIPTLQPWLVVTPAPATRFMLERNPFYHRVDTAGQQLPYFDEIAADVSTGGLMAAKANAGDADLLFRGLSMSDIPILKEGEAPRSTKPCCGPTRAAANWRSTRTSLSRTRSGAR